MGIAVGGLLNVRRVAETMSKKITPLNHDQVFTVKIVMGMCVFFASRLGARVSVGSIFGIGSITKITDIRVVSNILLAWHSHYP